MTVDLRQPLNLDIVLVAGDDYSRSWIVTENAVAYVSTGATIVTTIESESGVAQATNFTSAFTTVVSDTVLTYSLTDTETSTLGVGGYRWSLKVTKGGVTQSWFAGKLQVKDREYAGRAASSSATTLNLTTSTGTALGLTVTAAVSGAGTGDLLAANNLSELTATASTARTNLGLGTAATQATSAFDAAGAAATAQSAAIAAAVALVDDLSGVTNASAARTALGLGTAATTAATAYDAAGAAAAAQAASQPLDSDLTAIAALTTTTIGRSLLAGADAAALRTILALGTAAVGAGGGVSVATYSAGWPTRPAADLVIWFSSDRAATTPGAATGSDIVILPPPLDKLAFAISDETTALTTGTAKLTFAMPAAFTVATSPLPRLTLTAASSSGLPTVDINKNGTSILGASKLSCDASELTSTTAATATSVSTTAFADGDVLTIDIDTAGTGAKGAKVVIYGTWTT